MAPALQPCIDTKTRPDGMGAAPPRAPTKRRLAVAVAGVNWAAPPQPAGRPTANDIEDFVALIVADDLETARAVADRVIVRGGGRDALLRDLLTPAARLLGDLWSADTCDFITVTLGVHRLDQIMKETISFSGQNDVFRGDVRRILLVPAPGEQHSFGLHMVADLFREAGWCVRSGSTVTKPQLLRLVQDEWFDAVGLSVSGEVVLKSLPACIRAVRQASCNPGVYVMVGGHAMALHPQRARFLGADHTTVDADQALAAVNIFLTTIVTTSLRQGKTRLVEKG